MSVLGRCKICKQELVTKVDPECPQEWVNKLLPLLTCNPCYDRMRRKRQAQDLIEKSCMAIIQAGYASEEKERKVTAQVRISLEEATKKYAKAIAEYYGSNVMVWDVEFVNLLIQKPDKWLEILGQYRALIRKEIRDGRSIQPEGNRAFSEPREQEPII